jgi:hypothetical protein
MLASPSVAPSGLLSLTASASGASMEVGATLPISLDTRRKLKYSKSSASGLSSSVINSFLKKSIWLTCDANPKP